MRKRLRNLALLLFIVVAYVLVFPRPSGTEPLLARQWMLSLGGAQTEASAGSRVRPFRVGERFGYFHTDGRLLYAGRVRYGLAQSREYFSNYSAISENVVLQRSDGSLYRSIPAEGYPLLDGSRLYVFGPSGSAVSEWEPEDGGTLAWSRDFLSVLTDLDGGPSRTAVGLLNGGIELLGADGESEFSYDTEGSRLAVTLAVALGPGEEALAAVAGLDPQKLVLFEKHTEGFFPTFQLELESEYRRPVLLEFLQDGRLLVAEQEDGVLVYDREHETFATIDLGGSVEGVAALSQFELLLATSQVGEGGAGGRGFHAVLSSGERLFRQTVAAEHVFLSGDESRIYFGFDGRLGCIELVNG